jgi:hypothetical protein
MFKAPLEKVDETICYVLDTRDIRFIGSLLARIQLVEDPAREETNRDRLSVAVNAFRLAQNDVDQVRRRVDQVGLGRHFLDISARRRVAFTLSPWYQATVPYLSGFYGVCIATLSRRLTGEMGVLKEEMSQRSSDDDYSSDEDIISSGSSDSF